MERNGIRGHDEIEPACDQHDGSYHKSQHRQHQIAWVIHLTVGTGIGIAQVAAITFGYPRERSC